MPAFLPPAHSARLPVVSGRPRNPAHAVAEKNAALVWYVLNRRFSFLTSDAARREEAWGVGYLALVEAAQRFDPAQGTQFSTYACRVIEGNLLRSLRPARRAARLPCVSLETPLGDGGSDLAEVVADPQAAVPGVSLISEEGFARLLSVLPVRQREVMVARYEQGLTLAEVAAAQGVSRGRISGIERDALARLRRKGALWAEGGRE